MYWRNRVFKLTISKTITPELVEKVSEQLDKWTLYKPELIALVVNSMGGSIIQTKNLATILKKYSKIKKYRILLYRVPIYCFGEDIVVKSALGLLTIGDKVYVNPYAIVGNIGFSHQFANIRGLAEKWFVKEKLIASNENMKILNPFHSMTVNQQEWIEKKMQDQEAELIDMIEQNRKLDKTSYQERVDKIYKNGLISPAILLESGIIDGYTGLDELCQGKKIRKL